MNACPDSVSVPVNLFLATSNEGKVASFRRVGLDLPRRDPAQSREPMGTIHEIVAHKARQERAVGAIVEDTHLYVDGHPEVGCRIKQETPNIRNWLGRRVLWVVGVGLRLEDRIDIYVGRVSGTLVEPMQPVSLHDFGEKDFGRFLMPDLRGGALGTVAYYNEHRPAMMRLVSARGLAVAGYFSGRPEMSVPLDGEWTGAWQDE